MPTEVRFAPPVDNLHSTNPISHFICGLRFFFGALPLLKHPALLALSLLPIVLTLIALVSLAFFSVWMSGYLLRGSTSLASNQALLLLGQAVIFLLVLSLGYFLYLPLTRILFAPLSEALSQRVLKLIGGRTAQSPMGWGRAMWEGVKLIILQLAVALVILPLGLFFPLIGGPVGLIVAVFFCGFDYLDVPLSAQGLPLRKKLGLIWRYKSLILGLGAAGYLSLLIPVANLVSLPVGVIGATLLVHRLGEGQ